MARRLAAVVGAVALAVSGCSSSGTPQQGGDTGAPATSALPTALPASSATGTGAGSDIGNPYGPQPPCPADVAHWTKSGPSAITVYVGFTAYETVSVMVNDAAGNILGSKADVLLDGSATWPISLTEPVSKISDVFLSAAGARRATCNVTGD